jgi:hypothetical protein
MFATQLLCTWRDEFAAAGFEPHGDNVRKENSLNREQFYIAALRFCGTHLFLSHKILMSGTRPVRILFFRKEIRFGQLPERLSAGEDQAGQAQSRYHGSNR